MRNEDCKPTLSNVCSKEPTACNLREKLAANDATLTYIELDEMMNEFVGAAKEGALMKWDQVQLHMLLRKLFCVPCLEYCKKGLRKDDS